MDSTWWLALAISPLVVAILVFFIRLATGPLEKRCPPGLRKILFFRW